ncbi:MAG: hypothetical protein IPL27_10830 [Lewinellaceae bacterium]|nr:hypothetical protein [Lewinellaceae bacterium]
MNIRLTLLEIFLIEMVVWLGLWLSNDYLATLLTLTIGAIVLSVLLIALAAEAIEPTKVPRRYFWIMAVSILAPVLAAGLYVLLFGGKLGFWSRGL